MSHILDYERAKALGWKERNAEIQRCARSYLAAMPATAPPISTMMLAQAICPQAVNGPKVRGVSSVPQAWANISQTLARMAPHMSPFATHDGKTVTRYKRQWKRWQWRGQSKGATNV